MRNASEQLAKRAAFDQMNNVRPNARQFGQMRSAFNQCRTPKLNLLQLMNCAAHLAIGASEACKPITAIRGTGATHRMLSRRRVSRR